MATFEDSLAAYDYAISKCPFDLLSTNGHALLLKELGRSDEAIAAYDRITSLHPDFPSARYGKASCLLSKKSMVKPDSFRQARHKLLMTGSVSYQRYDTAAHRSD